MKDINELSVPEELKYAKDHEWLSPTPPHRIGISDFAQDQLGDLTYVELPGIGATYRTGDEFGSLESIKSVSSLYMPVDGTVVAVNEKLRDDPGLVNREPYGGGWLVEIDPADVRQSHSMMSGADYRRHLHVNF